LYAEDSNLDGKADRWVKAGDWLGEANVLAIRLALLLTTPDPAGIAGSESFEILGQVFKQPDDGRMRRVFESTFSIRGRRN
jgi:hypothetical protein